MPAMSSQALRTAVINAVTSDAAFRENLAKDATKAITARFGQQSLSTRVFFEQPNDLTFLIPAKTDKLAQAIGRVADSIGSRTPTRGEFEALVVHRAWNDAAFLSALRSDAKSTIDAELAKCGASVPQGASVVVYEEQPNECLISVPRPVDAGAELSEAELEAVAGGEGAVILVTAAVVGAVATVIADKIIEV